MRLWGASLFSFGVMTSERADEILLAWEERQSASLKGDPLWKLNCYRESLFLADHVRTDAAGFGSPAEDSKAKEQLRSAVASIAANIGEGYGRPSTPDRMRFLAFALGSAREAIAWYVFLRPSAEHSVVDDRIERLSRIRRMLIGLMARLKDRGGREFDRW